MVVREHTGENKQIKWSAKNAVTNLINRQDQIRDEMVSTTLYNRSEIKENLDELFTCIRVGDYGQAKNASDKLADNLQKYYNSRGMDANYFYELFEDLNFALLYTTNGQFKRELVHDSLREIIKRIKSATTDPLARLKEIYGDIRHLLGDINKRNATEIIDCFDEISELKPEIEAIGGPIYNYYAVMMQKIGDCASTIRRIELSREITGAAAGQIETKFSNLFQAMEKVLAPPIRLELTKKDVYDTMKQGISAEEIAEATGQSEEDLRQLFQQEQTSRMAEEMGK